MMSAGSVLLCAPWSTTLLLILFPTALAEAQAAPAKLACPPADSLYLSVSEHPAGRTSARTSRFVTYVVDSQFVFLSSPRDPRTGRTNDFALFGGLKATEISWISELKEHEAAHWATCPGVPSFSYSPRASAGGHLRRQLPSALLLNESLQLTSARSSEAIAVERLVEMLVHPAGESHIEPTACS
jgi:hypothetical protein